MHILKKINTVISKILASIMVLLFTFMIIALAIQVFARKLLNTGFTWTEEGARYGMIWLVFIGAAYIMINSEHVKVSLLEDLLKGTAKQVILVLQHVVMLIFVGFVFWFSLSQVKLAALGTSANTGLSNAIPYMVFPISMAVCVWACLYQILMLLIPNKEDVEAGKGGEI